MEKIDARKLSTDAQQEIRYQVIRLKEKGLKRSEISDITGIHLNSQTLIKFMERLIKDSKKKVFLILDNLKVHHSHMVVDWLKEHKKQIEVFHLPAYSPELNPDEYLNCDLKVGVHSGSPTRTKDSVKK